MSGSEISFDCTQLSRTGYYTTWAANIRSAISALQGGSSLQGGSQRVNELEGLLTLEHQINTATQCIVSAINTLSTSSTDVATMQVEVLNKTKQLTDAEKDISLAKDRVAYIRHPEQNTSNYESWFPLNRPMNPLSLIIIATISIFLGMFYLLMLLSAFDMDLIFYTTPNTGVSPFFMWLRQQLTLSFWIVLIVLISVVIYFVKRN